MDDCIVEISKQYPCREKLIKELYHLFGYKNHGLPSCVYLHGATGVGKTTIFTKFLNYLAIQHVFIDCVEFYTPKMFFEHIINKLRDHQLEQSKNYNSFAMCDSTEDFINELSGLNPENPYVIVLKNYHLLRDVDAHMLPVLMRFDKIVPGQNISCVLIGSKTVTNHISQQGLIPCINLRCEQYSKSDMLAIFQLQIGHLCKTVKQLINENDCDDEIKAEHLQIVDNLDVNFYIGYFNIFLDTFFVLCRNVKELIYLSNVNFPTYCKPVIDGAIDKNDLRKLWKSMELPFKAAMGTIFCAIYQKATYISKHSNENASTIAASSSHKRALKELELPYYTKYLLIAAYLASHNDVKIDKRLFTKHHGKQRKRLQNVRANAVVSEKLSTQVGPRSFTIDRLLAIFFSISENKVPLTANLLMQISNLVRLKYLNYMCGENSIMDGSVRLQCAVTLSFISLVGKQVGFNVRQYLCDFM